MKVTIEFNLPEEKSEHKIALNGSLYHSILTEVLGHIRSKLKYTEVPENVEKELIEIKKIIYEDGFTDEL